MRRAVFLLLAVVAAAGTIAVVASASRVGARTRPRQVPAALTTALAAAARQFKRVGLKPLTTIAKFPTECAVASGACVQGCALPIASTATAPAPSPPNLCKPGTSAPCVEYVARAIVRPGSGFCAAQQAPFPHIFRALPPRGHTRR